MAGWPASALRAKTAPPLLIDSHVHVWKHDPRFPFAAGRKVPDADATAETLLALMATNRVARTVLIQVIHYKWDNRYLADVLTRYPKRFLGVCRVDPEDPASPDTLASLIERGFHGVRLSPSAKPDGDWIGGPLMSPLWRRCAELKVPMTLLTEAPRLPQIVPLIEANPDLTVVIDHMADIAPDRGDDLARLVALARYPRVFVKISHLWSLSRGPYPYDDMTRQLKRLIDAFGPKRLMWGTDWPVSAPFRDYADIVALYRDHLDFLSPDERAQILGRTVQEVWPFGL
ncbi:amidohydrolase family protein [Sphingomonas sp. BIUV-7]|uniref:Amidohydrolase family protein n=1 Tax=Sphingomonas natans TaxID=3063330 RepID=A0ABT8Y3W7_9SPHN|nr:amidohydrolase family protein [Sphingomonas sp. BIUV-7]MDO6413000.1 amidohydrolase family protein [Sphingomonas sp. BIUV-7]